MPGERCGGAPEALRAGWGSVGGMVDAALLLDVVIIALMLALMLRSHIKSEEVHLRLDDIIEGVGRFAAEVLERTSDLRDLGSRIAPAIELHNHNPLEQVFSFIRGLKTGNFDDGIVTNPRDSAGQYGRAENKNEDSPTSEVIDLPN